MKFDKFLLERNFDLVSTDFIKKTFNKIKSDLVGKDFGNLEIEQILNKNFAPKGITFEMGFGTPQFSSMGEVGIINSFIDTTGHITIQYKDYFYEIFEDEYLYIDLINVISRTVSHEQVHLQQLKKIKSDKNKYELENVLSKITKNPENQYEYLSSKQEMMAFAVEAVEEFRNLNYSDKEILQKIKKPFDDTSESDIMFMYTNYFDYRGNWLNSKDRKEMQRILNRFLNYMAQYIFDN